MTSAESFLELESTGATMAGGTTYGWLGPRVSFGRDGDKPPRIATAVPAGDGEDDGESEEDIVLDFEFRLNVADPVAMLPADELFSGGKLLPLQLKPSPAAEAAGVAASAAAPAVEDGVSSRSSLPSLEMDQYVFSPKMPARCSSRWRDLLGLKRPPRQNQQEDGAGKSCPTTPPPPPRAAVLPSSSPSPREAAGSRYGSNPTVVRGLKHYFLHRNAKPSPSPTGSSIPLLRDSSTSSSGSDSSCRLSLSSSSSSLDHELDLPRLSLDSLHHHHHRPSSSNAACRKDRLLKLPAAGSSGDAHPPPPPAVRVGRSHARRAITIPPTPRGSSVDSPRMNSYGKIVFQSLGRSSSSPSALSGPKKTTVHHRAIGGSLQMERSYSANVVRVTPVLNVVPVCSSLRVASSSSRSSTSVLGAFFSPHKKDKDSSSSTALARGCKTATTITDAGGRGRDCAAPLVINN